MNEEKKKRSKQSDAKSDKGEENLQPSAPEGEIMVSLTMQEYDTLQKELAEIQNQCKENFEGWQRERADFMNYKKRIERDQLQLSQVITGNVIKKFLSVMDDMERALRNKPDGAEAQEWWSGVELIYRKLQTILEAEGVQAIANERDDFDPNFHEAISHEDHPEVESGKIIEVVQKGFTIGERIIRPALVRVAR
jgi:molecular chaperone GrpE